VTGPGGTRGHYPEPERHNRAGLPRVYRRGGAVGTGMSEDGDTGPSDIHPLDEPDALQPDDERTDDEPGGSDEGPPDSGAGSGSPEPAGGPA
jgi:hypothetical protein